MPFFLINRLHRLKNEVSELITDGCSWDQYNLYVTSHSRGQTRTSHQLPKQTFQELLSRAVIFLAFILVTLSYSAVTVAGSTEHALQLKDRLQPVSEGLFFRSDEYHHWGSSIIKGDNGQYHLFYSRWPKKYSFPAWLIFCEIAHAIADNPTGPWTYVDTALAGRGKGFWDAINAHNPKIKFFDGRYHLYYIATNWGDAEYTRQDLVKAALGGNPDLRWKAIRANQRTGVAVADSLNGPWRRLDHPLVEPVGPITEIAVNPAIDRGRDGKYYLIVKGDKPGSTRGARNQVLAIGNSPTGPFEIQSTPVIDYMDTEDMSIWYDGDSERFYGIFRVTHREPKMFIGLVSSPDGFHWDRNPEHVLDPKEIPFVDGGVIKPDRFERPFVYRENGDPMVLSMSYRKGDDTACVFIPMGKK